MKNSLEAIRVRLARVEASEQRGHRLLLYAAYCGDASIDQTVADIRFLMARVDDAEVQLLEAQGYIEGLEKEAQRLKAALAKAALIARSDPTRMPIEGQCVRCSRPSP